MPRRLPCFLACGGVVNLDTSSFFAKRSARLFAWQSKNARERQQATSCDAGSRRSLTVPCASKFVTEDFAQRVTCYHSRSLAQRNELTLTTVHVVLRGAALLTLWTGPRDKRSQLRQPLLGAIDAADRRTVCLQVSCTPSLATCRNATDQPILPEVARGWFASFVVGTLSIRVVSHSESFAVVVEADFAEVCVLPLLVNVGKCPSPAVSVRDGYHARVVVAAVVVALRRWSLAVSWCQDVGVGVGVARLRARGPALGVVVRWCVLCVCCWCVVSVLVTLE